MNMIDSRLSKRTKPCLSLYQSHTKVERAMKSCVMGTSYSRSFHFILSTGHTKESPIEAREQASSTPVTIDVSCSHSDVFTCELSTYIAVPRALSRSATYNTRSHIRRRCWMKSSLPIQKVETPTWTVRNLDTEYHHTTIGYISCNDYLC